MALETIGTLRQQYQIYWSIAMKTLTKEKN